MLGVRRFCVAWGEELDEEGFLFCGVLGMPEGDGEVDVDFLEAAVGYMVDWEGDFGGKGWSEGVEVAFEPAEWRGHDDFVEGVDGSVGCCDFDWLRDCVGCLFRCD